MRKHSVSTQFITAVHLQVLVCMRLQCLLGLRENFAGSNDDVLSLIDGQQYLIRIPYYAHRYLA